MCASKSDRSLSPFMLGACSLAVMPWYMIKSPVWLIGSVVASLAVLGVAAWLAARVSKNRVCKM